MATHPFSQLSSRLRVALEHGKTFQVAGEDDGARQAAAKVEAKLWEGIKRAEAVTKPGSRCKESAESWQEWTALQKEAVKFLRQFNGQLCELEAAVQDKEDAMASWLEESATKEGVGSQLGGPVDIPAADATVSRVHQQPQQQPLQATSAAHRDKLPVVKASSHRSQLGGVAKSIRSGSSRIVIKSGRTWSMQLRCDIKRLEEKLVKVQAEEVPSPESLQDVLQAKARARDRLLEAERLWPDGEEEAYQQLVDLADQLDQLDKVATKLVHGDAGTVQMDELDGEGHSVEQLSEVGQQTLDVREGKVLARSEGGSLRMKEIVDAVLEVHEKKARKASLVQPKLKVPDFYGDVGEFLPWKEMVEVAILQTRVPKLQQHVMVLGALKGKAHDLVKHVSTSEDSVNLIMRILDEEYNSPRVVVRETVARMTQHAKVAMEEYNGMSTYATIVESAANILRKRECFGDLNSSYVHDAAVSRLEVGIQVKWFEFWDGISKTEIWKGSSSQLEELGKFLRKQASLLRRVVPDENATQKIKGEARHHKQSVGSSFAAAEPGQGPSEGRSGATDAKKADSGVKKCPVCANMHQIWDCKVFKAMTPEKRYAKAEELRLHFVCLQRHWRGTKCPSGAIVCKDCKPKHHVLLHGGKSSLDKSGEERKARQEYKSKEDDRKGPKVTGNSGSVNQVAAFSKNWVLGVIKVEVSANGKSFVVGALIDEGSSFSTIEERLAEELGLRCKMTLREVFGYNGVTMEPSGEVEVAIRGIREDESFKVQLMTKKRVNLPRMKASWKQWAMQRPQFSHIPVEDIDYSDVRLVIGMPHKKLTVALDGTWVEHEPSGACAYKTRLGWVITGPIGVEGPAAAMQCVAQEGPLLPHQALTEEFRKFTAVETLGVEYDPGARPYDVEKQLERMKASLQHDGERFTIPMLWKEDLLVPESEKQARQRLRSLQKKLEKNLVLKEMYKKSIVDDEEKGYIRKLSEEEAKALRAGKHYFLPHFPVFHPDKPHKVRRVLDSKAKNAGISLNMLLETGPDLLNSIFRILVNFRLGKIAVNADVTEMFLQVRVRKEDEAMLAFLWETEDGREVTYVNTRHVFGAKCSPAIACFCVRQTVADHEDLVIKEAVEEEFYMDDYYNSFDSVKEAGEQSHKVKKSLRKGGFVLGKWISNSPGALEGFKQEELAPASKELRCGAKNEVQSKALGVVWDLVEDFLHLASRKMHQSFVNLAQFLSILASVYDPLGFFQPYIFSGKLLMGKVWRAITSWHTPIPGDLLVDCQEWCKGLSEVAKLKISRWYGTRIDTPLWLHIFCDASKEGYGAVAFIRFVGEDGELQTAFVASKSRLAPAKPLTIPKLELQGVVLGFRLARSCLRGLFRGCVKRLTFWTDSSVVEGQIARPASHSKDVFVANRLGEIHSRMDSAEFQAMQVEIRHVATSQNAADRVTRPVTAAEFAGIFQSWIKGPDFLQRSEGNWPERLTVKSWEDAAPGKVSLLSAPGVHEPRDVIYPPDADPADFADLTSFLLVSGNLGPSPSVEDLGKAEDGLVLEVQQLWYSKEIALCRTNGGSALPHQGPLKGRILFLDKKGLLRCRSRFEYANFLNWEEQNPVILPGRSKLGRLMIRDAHRRVGHLGSRATQAEVRRKYELSRFSVVKAEVFRCSFCRQQRPVQVRMPVAPIHQDRLAWKRPAFSRAGIDFFGPFNVVGGKAYGLIFICLTTRSVHLELTRSLDTEAFLMALERFFSRRGMPSIIRSDGGASFKAGAIEVVRMFDAEEVRQRCRLKHRVEFEVNPPGSPHWGGLWERHVGIIKGSLKAAGECVRKRLTFDELFTSLIKVEWILNNRPVAFNDDGVPLRPIQLLSPLASNGAELPAEISTVDAMRHVALLTNKFWEDWRTLYLAELSVDRITKGGRFIPLQVGDNILVDEKGNNRFTDKWETGKVVAIHPSADGCVRSVTVETARGRVRRAINRLSVTEEDIFRRSRQPPC